MTMPNYMVVWEIDVEADSPAEAALAANAIMKDASPENTATVFTVINIVTHSADTIDIGELNQ